jgi:hypothetical protein
MSDETVQRFEVSAQVFTPWLPIIVYMVLELRGGRTITSADAAKKAVLRLVERDYQPTGLVSGRVYTGLRDPGVYKTPAKD